MGHVIREMSDRICRAKETGTALRIRGGGTKDFHAARLDGEVLDTRAYAGVLDYEPSELVLTARAGTPLAEVESLLESRGQQLACEAPHFGAGTTIGGCVAAGLSGPARASAGSVRDFVLGVRLLDGRGQDLRFGGRVMKNVAGFDVSRLLAGSWGTLAVLTEVSVKVLPRPVMYATLRFDLDEAAAIQRMNQLAGRAWPITATCWHDGVLAVRLSGSEPGVRAARKALGGELLEAADDFWRHVRDQTWAPLQAGPLWRCSVRASAPPLELGGTTVVEWHGSLRWVRTALPASEIRARTRAAGGHATLFRSAAEAAPTALIDLPASLLGLHQRLKAALDPAGIFGRGRLHPAL
jgi:glycolate oxidase FAD binding subunit